MPRLPVRDLDHVLEHARDAFESLRGARILMTGGTGFFGCWLVESLLHADDRLGLGTSVVLLSRDPNAFARRAPHLAGSPRVALLQGDVRTFAAPRDPFTHLACGLVGEGDGQNVERTGLAGGDQMSDARRQHARFPGASTGENENGTLGRFHGGSLFRVQSRQVGRLRRDGCPRAGAERLGTGRVAEILGQIWSSVRLIHLGRPWIKTRTASRVRSAPLTAKRRPVAP